MLRTRIFLNLIPFALILIAVVAYALFLFSRLAREVEENIADNYRRELVTVEMVEALDRMDKAVTRSRDELSTARVMFEDNLQLFRQRLDSQRTNPAARVDRAGLLQVETNFVVVQQIGLRLLATNLPPAEARQKFDEFAKAKVGLYVALAGDEVRERNRKDVFTAIVATIRDTTRTITSSLALGLLVALLILAYASLKLGRAILTPIQTLTRAAREIGQGNLDQTVPVMAGDELGELAGSFNRMADQLKVYRQSANEQIVRLHRTMEAALASFSDPVYILDRSGHIELSNRAAEQLSAELQLDGTLPPKLAAAATEALARNQDFRPESFAEVIILRPRGEERFFLPRLHIMREEDKLVGVAVVLHDVTRFRLLDDAKTNLVATVSHELKTPLTSVRMVLHLMLEKSVGPLNPQQAELLETARKDSERLLRMLDALLDIARLEAGAAALSLERWAPPTLLASIEEEIRHSVATQNLKLVTVIPPGLPEVNVDRQQIGPVFHNFLSNAIKHSPPGGTIRLAAVALPGGAVEFSVHDEGPGLAPEHQGLVFDRFYRAPGQKKRGAGLGLSIAREIVVAHGGRVGVRSQPGHGSEFFFVLPAAGTA
jgi:signal transduction histidine kinase/HAMP domain-containing protein